MQQIIVLIPNNPEALNAHVRKLQASGYQVIVQENRDLGHDQNPQLVIIWGRSEWYEMAIKRAEQKPTLIINTTGETIEASRHLATLRVGEANPQKLLEIVQKILA